MAFSEADRNQRTSRACRDRTRSPGSRFRRAYASDTAAPDTVIDSATLRGGRSTAEPPRPPRRCSSRPLHAQESTYGLSLSYSRDSSVFSRRVSDRTTGSEWPDRPTRSPRARRRLYYRL